MADYISRKAVNDFIDAYHDKAEKEYYFCDEVVTDICGDIGQFVDDLPAADVVAVVRCRECKEWVPGQIEATDNFIPPRCVWLNKPMHADDYCSYGERSDDGDKKGM